MNLHKYILIPVLFLFMVGNALSQPLTSNDGFEGISAPYIPPTGWNNCNDGLSTVDTQPGQFSNEMPASEGSTYISMVAREIGPPGSVETLWSDLNMPFKKDHCYTLMIDLSLSHQYVGRWNWEDYYFDNPCRFQVLGLNGDCTGTSQTELLWQSEVIDHFVWQSYEIPIIPKTNTFSRIVFRVDFTEPGNFKNSALMVDNLRFKEERGYIINNCNLLSITDDVTMINWYRDGISLDQHSDQLQITESGHYSATFFNADNCFILASGYFTICQLETITIYDTVYEIVYDTVYVAVHDTVYLPGELNPFGLVCYPNPTSNHVTIVYHSSMDDYCDVSIIDNTGREVSTMSYMLQTSFNTLLVPMEHLATGHYFVIFTLSNRKSTKFKIVKVTS